MAPAPASEPAAGPPDGAPDPPAEEAQGSTSPWSGMSAQERVLEEGGSPAVVKWTGRVATWVPPLAGQAGFWASVYARYARHRGSVLAGGLAFFALLSLVPSVLSLGALVAVFLDPAEFVARIEELLKERPDLLKTLTPFLDQIAALPPGGLNSLGVAGAVGVLLSLYAASRFVYVGRQVLDVAFEQEPEYPSLLGRGIAILITLLAQMLIIVSVLALTLIPSVLDRLGIGEVLSQNLRVVRTPLGILVVYLMLTAAMRFGIRRRRAVGWVNLGAALGTALVVLGSVGLGWYLTASNTYSQIVAVLGGVIALEIWLYLIGTAIVLSAEVEGMRQGFRRRDRPSNAPS